MKVVSLSCANCGSNLTLTKPGVYECGACGSQFFMEGDQGDYKVKAGTLVEYVGNAVNIFIPEDVLVIGKGVFSNLTAIENVFFPKSLMRIEDSAFQGCVSLKNVLIPSEVRHIGEQAFKESGVQQLVIEGDLDFLGMEAFMQCAHLTHVTIKGKLPSDCNKAFKLCTSLAHVDVAFKEVAPAFFASMECQKKGDKRPTYFDLFQGTPFFEKMCAKYKKRECIQCGGGINRKNVCENCGEAYYKQAMAGACYVATCVYGSYDCPQVWTLRRYRDNILGSTWYGRLFIRTYYAISPTLVKWFGNTAWFKNLWKSKLDRKVARLQAKGVEDTPYQDKNW